MWYGPRDADGLHDHERVLDGRIPMNASYSLTRREEKLGAGALVVAIIAVLLWGQVGPLGLPVHINQVVPAPSLEGEAARVLTVPAKVEPPSLQSRVWTGTPADA